MSGVPSANGVPPSRELSGDLLCQVEAVAPLDGPVLIVGDGRMRRSQVARGIHDRSLRTTGPFVTLNCAEHPLMGGGEIFGVMPGCHCEAKPGAIALAEHGTLYLDGIENVDSAAQQYLVRLLETGMSRRYGAAKERRCDVRVMAGTCADLTRMPDGGMWGGVRADLVERLSTTTITLPPAEDSAHIPWLGQRFSGKPGNRDGFRKLGLAPDTIEMLFVDWPDEFRCLKWAVERAVRVAVSEGGIEVPAWHPLAEQTREDRAVAFLVLGRRQYLRLNRDISPTDIPWATRTRRCLEKLARRLAAL